MDQMEIIAYCNDLLNIQTFQDFCPNGLQVEGDHRHVKKVVLGVSISVELIQKAIQKKADLILTHHGFLWNKDDRVIKGPYKQKIKLLLDYGIAAAAYHLPLDYHPELGNNIQLAKSLGLTEIEAFSPVGAYFEAVMGKTKLENIDKLTKEVGSVLKRKPTVLSFGKHYITKVAVATGGAQNFFTNAIENGADCFITGEISEKNFAMSQEYEVHFISAGHYATETFGIQALGKHLENQFDLSCEFIDIDNPV